MDIVGQIASVSSSKPLMKKPEQVNVIALPGKVAGNSVEAEFLHTVPNSRE
jgi:hypothetical protein